jgi:hypothetical protein
MLLLVINTGPEKLLISKTTKERCLEFCINWDLKDSKRRSAVHESWDPNVLMVVTNKISHLYDGIPCGNFYIFIRPHGVIFQGTENFIEASSYVFD